MILVIQLQKLSLRLYILVTDKRALKGKKLNYQDDKYLLKYTLKNKKNRQQECKRKAVGVKIFLLKFI